MRPRPDATGSSVLDAERTRAFLFQAARRVTTVVRREWRRDPKALAVEIGMGADGTPTKRIDQVAEDVVIEALKGSDLQLNVLSEECGFIDNGADHTLVVDPIDGTRNAVHGIPFYCVALAVGKKSVRDIEYALVRNLANDDTYWARRGHGATLNGEPIRVRAFNKDEILIAALFEDEDDVIAGWAHRNMHVRDMGSSALEMALVASGSFDGFICARPFLRVVDIAASTLLVREAGGSVRTTDGAELDTAFDVKTKTSVIATADPQLMEVFR